MQYHDNHEDMERRRDNQGYDTKGKFKRLDRLYYTGKRVVERTNERAHNFQVNTGEINNREMNNNRKT